MRRHRRSLSARPSEGSSPMSHGREDDFEERMTIHQFAQGSHPPVAERTPPPDDGEEDPNATRRVQGEKTNSPRTLSFSGPSSAARDSDSGSLPRSTNLDAHFVKGGGPVPGEVLFD